jgi:hypothetical protein
MALESTNAWVAELPLLPSLTPMAELHSDSLEHNRGQWRTRVAEISSDRALDTPSCVNLLEASVQSLCVLADAGIRTAQAKSPTLRANISKEFAARVVEANGCSRTISREAMAGSN